MGLYNFKERFIPFILDSRKQHTIRKDREDGRVDQPGDICHCYFGLRTKQVRLLGRWPCVKVERIEVYATLSDWLQIEVEGIKLNDSEMEQLARRDGFKDFADMAAYWRAGDELPFKGHIIHWKFTKERKRARKT